jgi:hypothetical protein
VSGDPSDPVFAVGERVRVLAPLCVCALERRRDGVWCYGIGVKESKIKGRRLYWFEARELSPVVVAGEVTP